MIKMLRIFWELLSARDRRRVWVLFGFLGLGAVLESAGIALFIPLILLLSNSGPESAPSFLQPVFDAFNLTRMQDQLIALAGVLALFYAVKNAMLGFVAWMQARIPHEMLATVGERLLRIYLDRAYERHLMQNSAEIIRNLTYSSRAVLEHGMRGAFTIVMETALSIAALAVVFAIEPAGAVIIAAVLGATLLAVFARVRKKIGHWVERLQDSIAVQVKCVNESLDGFREIKLTGVSAGRAARFGEILTAAAPYNVKIAVTGQIPRLAGETAVIAAIFAVIIYLTRVADESPERMLAVFGVFAAAAMRVLPSASRVAEAAANLKGLSAIMEIIVKDLHEGVEEPDAPAQPSAASPSGPPAAIAVENARYSYPGAGAEALSGVSLDIPPGAMVCVAGPSGAGKSTLIDIILGLIFPASGAVTADGRSIHEDIQSWRRRIGYVPQSVSVADESLRDNILFGREKTPDTDARIAEVCRMVRLEELLDEKRGGLDARLGERGAWLSGGQRQRIGLARALYGRPSLLVLDEPVSAVDEQTAQEIISELAALKGECSVILIAHSLDVIRRCGHIVYMEDGEILGGGSYDDLMRSSPQFRKFTAVLGAGPAPSSGPAAAQGPPRP
ncbi:MAG: ABC transporter ATP-binding protein [Rhodospirillales bacterium]